MGKLRELNISNNRLGFEGAEYISDALKEKLQKLIICDNDMVIQGGTLLFYALKENKTLQELNIGGNNMSFFKFGGTWGSDLIRDALKESGCFIQGINFKSYCIKYINYETMYEIFKFIPSSQVSSII